MWPSPLPASQGVSGENDSAWSSTAGITPAVADFLRPASPLRVRREGESLERLPPSSGRVGMSCTVALLDRKGDLRMADVGAGVFLSFQS